RSTNEDKDESRSLVRDSRQNISLFVAARPASNNRRKGQRTLREALGKQVTALGSALGSGYLCNRRQAQNRIGFNKDAYRHLTLSPAASRAIQDQLKFRTSTNKIRLFFPLEHVS